MSDSKAPETDSKTPMTGLDLADEGEIDIICNDKKIVVCCREKPNKKSFVVFLCVRVPSVALVFEMTEGLLPCPCILFSCSGGD